MKIPLILAAGLLAGCTSHGVLRLPHQANHHCDCIPVASYASPFAPSLTVARLPDGTIHVINGPTGADQLIPGASVAYAGRQIREMDNGDRVSVSQSQDQGQRQAQSQQQTPMMPMPGNPD